MFAVDSGSTDRDMERVSIVGGKHLNQTLLELPFDVDDTNQVVNVLRIIEKGRDTTPEQNP